MSSSKFDWLLSSLTPNESQVPSTAEIIQKCLSVNPFDLKFREANLQQINCNGSDGHGQHSIGHSGDHHSHHLLGSTGNLPTTSGLGSVLNLPPSLSSTHSPGIFSNINVLTADIEGEIRKTIDLSRKVQQLRENGLLSKQDDGQQLKTPCTSDVLNAVLDMSAAHQLGSGQSSPFISSTSLIAGLSGLKAALTSSANQHSAQDSQQHLVPTSSIPNFKVEPDPGGDPTSTTAGGNNTLTVNGGFTPVSAQGKTMSSPDLHASGLAVAGFKQHSPVLPPEALMVFQSVASCSSTGPTLAVPSLNQNGHIGGPLSLSAQSSPGGSLRSAISPGQGGGMSGGTSLAELTSAGTSPLKPEDGWRMAEPKPLCPPQITIAQQSPYSKTPEPREPSESGKSSHGREKHHSKKYAAKYNGGSSSADSQVSSTRGGRGRRSAINDMPPDERRNTILERNKAAAVRYRKRKKEEHDEMIGRVHGLEQEKNALETQNSVLRRELERLTFLLQERESRCVCKANQLQVGMSMIGGDEVGRSPSAAGFLNGYGAGGGGGHHSGQQMRPGSSHSTQ